MGLNAQSRPCAYQHSTIPTTNLQLIQYSPTHNLYFTTLYPGKVGYRVHLANRGDEQEVRPFKVAFDLGNVRFFHVWDFECVV